MAWPNSDRPKPIRYDYDTWLVMRNDPVLPAAIITRQKTADGVEYFRAATWDLEPEKRLLIGRSATLGGADNLVRYKTPRPPIPSTKEGNQDNHGISPLPSLTAVPKVLG